MRPKAVFIDLDGTLLSNTKMISSADYRAIKEYTKYGGKVFIATGRSSVATSNIVRRLNVNSEYIAYNGACVYLGSDQYEYFPLEQNEIDLVFSIADRYSLEIMLYTKKEVIVKKITSTNFSSISDTIDIQEFDLLEESLDRLKIIELPQLHGVTSNASILKMKLFPIREDMFLRAYEEMKSFNLNAIYTSKYIEVTSCLSNKYIGAIRILDKYCIDIIECIVIGDGENDIKLLEHSGVGVAMDNACENAKRIADYVTGANDRSGVAEAITKYALKKS